MGRIADTRKLYKETLERITKTEDNWLSFLDTSSWQFKYNFRDKVLIYAQNPKATACASMEIWNRKVKRWVNENANYIFVMADNDESPYPFRLVFDVSDTHNYSGTDYKLWSVKTKYEEKVIETLDSKFGAETEGNNLADCILNNSYNMVNDNILNYMDIFEKNKEGTDFENLSNDEIYSRVLPMVYSSVAYIMMKRCGIDTSRYIPKEEFTGIKDFADNKLITILGTTISDIAKMGIREIAKTVDNLQKQKKIVNHTFEKNQDSDYSKGKEIIEGGFDYGENRIQKSGQLQYAKSNIRAGEDSKWKIRQIKTSISKDKQTSRLYDIMDGQEVEQTSNRSTGKSYEDDKRDSGEISETRWNRREIENDRSNEMDRTNEQLQEYSRGTSDEGIDLQLEENIEMINELLDEQEQKEVIAEVENNSHFSFTQEMIDSVLREGSHFEEGKFRIYEFLSRGLSDKENANFLKNEYGIGGRSRDSNGILEDHNAKGIILANDYGDNAKKLTLNWTKVGRRIKELISSNRYFNQAEKDEYYNWLDANGIEKINQLTEKERIVIERRYDLNGEGVPKDFESIGLELGLSRERIRQIEAKALKKLRYRVGVRKNVFKLKDLRELMTEGEKKDYCQLDDKIVDICLEMTHPQDEDVKRDLEFLKKVMEEFKERSEKRQQEEKKMQIEETRQRIIDGTISMREIGLSDKIVETLIALEIKSIKEFSNNTPAEIKNKTGLNDSYITQIMEKMNMYNLYMKKPEEIFELKIEDLGLSVRSYNSLVRAGLNTVGEILVKSKEDIIGNLGINLYNEICEKIAPYKVLVQKELEKKQQEEMNQDIFEEAYFDEITIEELDLSTRTYNILYRGGCRNLLQLLNMTESELKKIRNMGRKSFEEIFGKLEPYRKEYEAKQKKKIEETRQRIIDRTISMKEIGLSYKIIDALNASEIKSITEFSKSTGKQIMLKTGLDLISANNIIKLLRKLNLHEKTPDEIPIEESGISVIACHWLQQYGYNMLEDLMNLSESDLMRIDHLGPKRVEEIMSKLEPYREQYKTQIEDNKKLEEQQKKLKLKRTIESEEQLERKQKLENSEQVMLNRNVFIEELNLSTRSYNCIKRQGYRVVKEVLHLTVEDLLKIRNLGGKGAEEIMKKLKPYREMIVEAERQKEEQHVGQKEQKKEKPVTETEQKPTDLHSVKAKKDELHEIDKQLKSQMNKAQALLDECNMAVGEDKDDKKAGIDD